MEKNITIDKIKELTDRLKKLTEFVSLMSPSEHSHNHFPFAKLFYTERIERSLSIFSHSCPGTRYCLPLVNVAIPKELDIPIVDLAKKEIAKIADELGSLNDNKKNDTTIIKKINELSRKKHEIEALNAFFSNKLCRLTDIYIPDYLRPQIKEIVKVEYDKLHTELFSCSTKKEDEKVECDETHTICDLARKVGDMENLISEIEDDNSGILSIPKYLDHSIKEVLQAELIKVNAELSSYIINNIGQAYETIHNIH